MEKVICITGNFKKHGLVNFKTRKKGCSKSCYYIAQKRKGAFIFVFTGKPVNVLNSFRHFHKGNTRNFVASFQLLGSAFGFDSANGRKKKSRINRKIFNMGERFRVCSKGR